MYRLLISLFIALAGHTAYADATALNFGPLVVADTTGWSHGSQLDCIRANGIVLTLADTNQPSTQIVFLKNVTPAPTEQDHISHVKLFLNNIRSVYPNASISQLHILDTDVPFVSIYDLSGDSFFWGSIRHDESSYDIAVTTHQRIRQLPAAVIQVLDSITVPTEKASPGQESD